MTTILMILQAIPDTAAVKVLTEPVTHVSIFSDNQVLQIVQAISTILIAMITGWVSIQLAKVKSQVTLVHKEINSRMTELIEKTKITGIQEGKDQEIKDQKLRDESK